MGTDTVRTRALPRLVVAAGVALALATAPTQARPDAVTFNDLGYNCVEIRARLREGATIYYVPPECDPNVAAARDVRDE